MNEIKGKDISTVSLEYNELVVFMKNGEKYYLPLGVVYMALQERDYSIKMKRTRTYITNML